MFQLSIFIALFAIAQTVSNVTKEDSKGYGLLFTSLTREVEDVKLRFELPGGIPKWIKGTLVKNGPGKFEMGHKRVNHAFDGFGKLSSWRFAGDGKSVTFSTKLQQTGYYRDSVKLNTIAPYTLFGDTVPAETTEERIKRTMKGMDNNVVNVKALTKQLSIDTNYMILNDMWNLYTININNLTLVKHLAPLVGEDEESLMDMMMDANKMAVPSLSSAHPLFEGSRDNWITYYIKLNPLGKSIFNVIRMGNDIKPRLLTSWKIDTFEIPYMHSFGLTEKYVVFFEGPCYFELFHFAFSGTFEMKEAFQCHHDNPMYIKVVELATGKVTELKTHDINAKGLFLHSINSYEVNSTTIVADATQLPNFDQMTGLTLDNMLNVDKRNAILANGQVTRYYLNLKTGQVDVQPIVSTPHLNKALDHLDFPAINEDYRMKNYCYFWGTAYKSDGVHYGNWTLGKKSVCNSKNDLTWHKPNHYPMEPWFIATPNSKQEDDGVIVTSILDGEKGLNYLAVLNATNLKMINYAYTPIHLPMDFHGRFFENV
ncbi:unnamed protein product [Owenia fusiformis]|uniref:Uncharacterized protein n=1 Tax=Owenia fusiformis TaxID=6347 RepID=A0A8J1UC17_OWEFU|nr:unnamed protein product [Owenia fusiformis]